MKIHFFFTLENRFNWDLKIKKIGRYILICNTFPENQSVSELRKDAEKLVEYIFAKFR